MIDHRLVSSALDAVDTANFERFAQAFYGAIQDREFVPLGGVHDGGAEGFDAAGSDPEVFEDGTATSFIQVSKQETTRKKIRATVRRLRDYGRNPKVLTYITSRLVADIDKEEAALTQELECRVSIRDAKYIEVYINSSMATQAAFLSYLQPAIAEKYTPGNSNIASTGNKSESHTLAVFLRQEVSNRSSRQPLVESISDSLIIWALRDTDPERDLLLTRAGIMSIIESALPTARDFIKCCCPLKA